MFADLLGKHAASLSIQLSDQQIAQLERHFSLLTRWNKVLNLTRIQDLEELVQLHYCESLILGTELPAGSLRIVDVGSGAGFPGIPVAILRAECSLTLVESHQRKAVFLQEATRELLNTNVLGVRGDEVRQTFDWAVSRAVKFHEISACMRRLAPNAAVLGGDKSPDDRFTWNKTKLPLGYRRFLWIRRST